MAISLNLTGDKSVVFAEIDTWLTDRGYKIIAKDTARPWGGFFVLDEAQAENFAAEFFPGIDVRTLRVKDGKLSPKILVVEANKRLSWQYHHRRSEIWKLAAGAAGVVASKTDREGEVKALAVGEIVRLEQGERHRLVGMDGWGVIAEIWQHTDPERPSDEDDIVRVQDDFGR